MLRNRSRLWRAQFTLTALSLALITTAPARPVQQADIPEEQVAKPNQVIDVYVRTVIKQQRLVGLALGVVRDGRIVYLKGYGWEDREAQIPVRAKTTLFRWASISKTLTALVAKKLEREGKLDLDAPTSRYLPDFPVSTAYLRSCKEGESTEHDGKTFECVKGLYELPLQPAEQVITTRQLLGHLGGIQHYTNGRVDPVPPEELTNNPETNQGFAWALDRIAGAPLVAKPGTELHYSTFAFNLIGAVLEAAGKQPFTEQVREVIREPLELTTLQPDYEWEKLPHRAVGYILPRRRDAARNGEPLEIARQGSNDVSWKLPGGGFVSTVEDLANYCGGLMGEKILPHPALEQMWVSQKTSGGEETGVGLSFFVGMHDNHRHVSHSGSQEKTKTMLLLSPDDNLCVVVMSNSVNANPDRIAQEIEEVYRRQMEPATKQN